MQISLQRRFTSGFLWQTQYMWSHGIADASIGAGESLASRIRRAAPAIAATPGIDVRHTMTSNAIYQLPFGKGAGI